IAIFQRSRLPPGVVRISRTTGVRRLGWLSVFFLTDPSPPELYPLSLHDALPICPRHRNRRRRTPAPARRPRPRPRPCSARRCTRSEEHTSELQSRENLVCRLLLEKKKRKSKAHEISAI